MTVDPDRLATALRLGYGEDVEAMDRAHDPLHVALCRWLGLPSYSMRVAAGDPTLTPEDHATSAIEEDAVLAVQRLMRRHGVDVPSVP